MQNGYPVEVEAALNLCEIGYMGLDKFESCVSKAAPLIDSDRWKIVWGPAVEKKYGTKPGNLVYVAASESEEYYSVVIRGTYFTKWHMIQDLCQYFEDMDVFRQVSPSYSHSGDAKISKGANEAFKIISFELCPRKQKKVTLEKFLQTIPLQKVKKIIVTGHSLGGCLTMPIALWMRNSVFAGKDVDIQPIAFAPLTAGNATFVQECSEARFQTPMAFGDDMDIFPHCWSDLQRIQHIYDSTVNPIPKYIGGLFLHFEDKLKNISYSQLDFCLKCLNKANLGNTEETEGKWIPSWDEIVDGFYEIERLAEKEAAPYRLWLNTMMSQHHLSKYYELLGFEPIQCKDK